MDNFKKALLSVITFTVFCGFIYTMVMTGICQVLFPNSANGKIIEVNGVKYGSELLGQQYTSDRYMWGRITKIDVSTYKDDEIATPMVTQLFWTNNLLILSGAKSKEKRHFYLKLSIKNNYSK